MKIVQDAYKFAPILYLFIFACLSYVWSNLHGLIYHNKHDLKDLAIFLDDLSHSLGSRMHEFLMTLLGWTF